MIKKFLLAIAVISISFTAVTAQNTLSLTLANFKKWAKVISNTGYPRQRPLMIQMSSFVPNSCSQWRRPLL